MIAIARGISALRSLFEGDCSDLARLVLNARSYEDADLALGLLAGEYPERDLVMLVNLREVIAELPRTPMPMAVDFATLTRVARLEPERSAFLQRWDDESGWFDLVVLGEGNMCYDLVIRTGAGSIFWTAYGPNAGLVHPRALELVLARETLLQRVVDLVQSMGLPFNPPMHFSLEDFRLEHDEYAMDDLADDGLR